MQVTFRIRRFDPEGDRQAKYQSFTVDLPDHAMVLDGLIKICEEQDETLALRCSCRSSICGSCAMQINHHTYLACKTRVDALTPHGEEISVEPCHDVMPVIKDLVVDMEPFWEKVRAITPWLETRGDPPPEKEYIVPNSAMEELTQEMWCIFCGSCVSDCTVMTVDRSFLGPAALAKAYRFVGDPRDKGGKQRLEFLSGPTGVWDCTHCFECVQQCPKDVAPMDQILKLRRRAMAAGVTNNAGARHSDEFTRSVEHSGWLDEFWLPLRSAGMLNVPAQMQMAMGPGLRMITSGKMPFPWKHRPIPGIEGVRQVVAKVGAAPSPR